ncbi:MAG: bis-aminopropyl spermidine synthase family protein, partial [candidate division WOR-3 bacterium]|nr:bis-aminopropyl spermidine synthase family protein [candidate division WOR-3 bacterium]
VNSYGVANLPILNIRENPKHSSQLVTQALFFSTMKILNKSGEWFQIILDQDNYIGWVKKSDIWLIDKNKYDDLKDKNIIIIGDDDLLSIALALTKLPKRIVVLDIDKRLVNFLKDIAKKYNFNIEIFEYNISEPFPKKLLKKFDVFSCEPLETYSGLKLFIGRGINALKKKGVGYFGLTIQEASYPKWQYIQKFINKSNGVITDIIKGFSSYPVNSYETFNCEEILLKKLKIALKPSQKEVAWYKSTLVRFEILGKPKNLIKPEKRYKLIFKDKEEDITIP